jgi:putative aldouronate transport system substrate-binding protein
MSELTKRNWMKTSMTVFSAAMLLAACGDGTENEGTSEGGSSENGAETSSEGGSETVQILTAVTGGKDDEGMRVFEDALGELAGYPVEMERPADNYGQTMLQMLRAGGEGLDLIYFDQSQMYDLIEQGALLDITEYVEQSEILSNNIDQAEWDAIEVDGRYYAGFNKLEVHRVVNINKHLLDEHGLALEEETLDGYYNLFVELKESVDDPNFYPLNNVMSDIWDIQPWMAAEGLQYGIVEDENGNKTVPYASDESIVVWEWLAQLYEEDLLDPSSLTDSSTDMRNKFQSGQTGVVVDWIAWTGLYNANAGEDYPEQFEAVPYGGIQNPDGDYMLSRGHASLWGIPASSDNVEGAIAVLETFATQEGGELLSVGVEGYAYEIEDGEFTHLPPGEEANNDHGAPFPIYKDFELPTDYNPGVEEGLEFLDYAIVPSVGPETNEKQQIVAQHALAILQGDVTPEEGVANMQDDLRANGIIE